MGGPGSGRHPGYPVTLDDRLAVDLRHLRRRSSLRPGLTGTLRWHRAERETASLGFAVGPADVLTLTYRTQTRPGAVWEDIREPVRLSRTPQPLGGVRTWFACPGCARRCAVLYGGARFVCRRCAGLPYGSQGETEEYRFLRRAQKLRERLGGSANLTEPFPERPKSMHRRTYERLRLEGQACERASLLRLARRFGLSSGGLDDVPKT